MPCRGFFSSFFFFCYRYVPSVVSPPPPPNKSDYMLGDASLQHFLKKKILYYYCYCLRKHALSAPLHHSFVHGAVELEMMMMAWCMYVCTYVLYPCMYVQRLIRMHTSTSTSTYICSYQPIIPVWKGLIEITSSWRAAVKHDFPRYTCVLQGLRLFSF